MGGSQLHGWLLLPFSPAWLHALSSVRQVLRHSGESFALRCDFRRSGDLGVSATSHFFQTLILGDFSKQKLLECRIIERRHQIWLTSAICRKRNTSRTSGKWTWRRGSTVTRSQKRQNASRFHSYAEMLMRGWNILYFGSHEIMHFLCVVQLTWRTSSEGAEDDLIRISLFRHS
jgi:hypothetical protein